MNIERTALFQQTAGCEVSHMPDGYVVYQSDREMVHYLNPAAAMVYELVGQKQPLDGIADYMKASFALPATPCNEVAACLEKLIAENLITPC